MRTSLLAALPAAALLALAPHALPAQAELQPPVQSDSQALQTQTHESRRVAGANRYETASQLSRETYPDGAAVAFVASGTSFPDALSGASLAAKSEGPLLLTRPDRVPAVVQEELRRLAPSRIVVLGGNASVSDDVLDRLRAFATSDHAEAVTRLAGVNRYATAARVSSLYARNVPVVYIAAGATFPDALAAAAAAGSDHAPVLLTRPGVLPDAVTAELSRLRPQRIVVVGGAEAVSEDVFAELRDYATGKDRDAVRRIAGANRYETAAALAATYSQGLPSAYVASGVTFPDALSAGAAAGALDVPVLLTRPHALPAPAQEQLQRLEPAEVVIMGGYASVGEVLAPLRKGLVPPPPAEDPAPGDFPDASTTGVPQGVTLTRSGSITVTEDGTVLEGLRIDGNVVVNADNVVIRDSLIRSGDIPVMSNGQNLIIEDSEIDGLGKANPAVAYDDYTLRRVNIHNVAEGPRISGGDVVIEDSYIHHLVQVGDNHTDAIQAVSGDNIRLIGNNVQTYNPDTGLIGNAAFQFGEEFGTVSDCLVDGNLLNGGNVTINGGGGGTTGAACTFRNNQFQRDFRYGATANLGPNVVWDSSNVWFDTGKPVR